jgi:enoyl-CoA hydratase
MELGLWCDFRVMAKDSYFGVYCRRWGVPLIDGGTVRLPRIVGQGRALEIILTGRKVPAEECLAIGLCEYLTPKVGRARRPRSSRRRSRASRRCACAAIGARRSGARAERARGLDPGVVQRPRSAGEGWVAGATRFKGGLGRHGDFGKNLTTCYICS